MRNVACLLMSLFVNLAPVPGEAGGFFRRVPEVGEWVRYEITQDHTSDPGKPIEISQRYTGSVVLKCVGEELIDERRCLWIETSTEMKLAPEIEFHAVNKVLVPEDELLRDTLFIEFIRGWQSEMKNEPVELTFPSDDLNTGAMARTARMSSRTIVVNEEEMELTYCEIWPQPTREDENGIWSGETTIWPHDDLAFGVASMDVVSNQLRVGEISSTTLNETRYDLVETGAGAVSDLPDHN